MLCCWRPLHACRSRPSWSKFIISESTRPDVIQLFSGLNDTFNLQGKKYSEHISDYISEFNGSSKVGSARLSEAEQKMLLLLPSQQPEFLNTIEKHWGNFKGQDSGVTLKMLLSPVDRQKRLESVCPGIWQQIFVASAEKNTLYVKRCVDIEEMCGYVFEEPDRGTINLQERITDQPEDEGIEAARHHSRGL